MNYSEQELTKKQNMLLDTRIKWKNRLRVSSRIAVIVLLIAFLLLQFFCVAGVVKGVSDSAPSLGKLDLLAKGTGAVIYDEGGNELQTLSTSSEQKEYVKLDKIPACVQYAFVAAVDSRFYEHKGVDLSAIFQEFVDDLCEKHQYDHAAASSKSSDLERKWQLCIRKDYEKNSGAVFGSAA